MLKLVGFVVIFALYIHNILRLSTLLFCLEKEINTKKKKGCGDGSMKGNARFVLLVTLGSLISPLMGRIHKMLDPESG